MTYSIITHEVYTKVQKIGFFSLAILYMYSYCDLTSGSTSVVHDWLICVIFRASMLICFILLFSEIERKKEDSKSYQSLRKLMVTKP